MKTQPKVPGPDDDRQGWMMFAHSGALDLRALTPDQIHLGDIVHALGNLNRFNGQTRVPISVLWHSVMVAQLCRNEECDVELEALLHDAAEAYVGDWINPLHGIVDPRTEGLRERIQETVYEAAGLHGTSARLTPAVEHADRLMARYEAEGSHGYGEPVPWHHPLTEAENEQVQAAVERIGPPSTRSAEHDFLRWHFLHECKTLLPENTPLAKTITTATAVCRATTDTDTESASRNDSMR